MEQIAVNCIANILGLGWAATPAGLKAMEELKNLEEERRAAGGMSGNLPAVPKGVASDEMCVFYRDFLQHAAALRDPLTDMEIQQGRKEKTMTDTHYSISYNTTNANSQCTPPRL